MSGRSDQHRPSPSSRTTVVEGDFEAGGQVRSAALGVVARLMWRVEMADGLGVSWAMNERVANERGRGVRD